MARSVFAFPIMIAFLSAPVLRAQSSGTTSPDPAKVAVIEELLSVTHPEQAMDQMLEQTKGMMISQSEKTLEDEVPSGVDKAKYEAALRDLNERILAEVKAVLDWQKMKPQMIAIYEDTFTLPELEGMLAFYKSAPGQAVITKLPVVMSKSMAMLQDSVKDLTPKIRQITDDEATKMKQAESPQPPK